MATAGCAASHAAMWRAFAQCRSIRTARVFAPRSTSQASNGPATAPVAFWVNRSRSPSAGSATTTAPPTTSLCPPRYFVVEWTDTSAPSASGCWRYGVAKVLSTASRPPTAWISLASTAMSATLSSGFVGVSHHSSRVRPGRRAARTASGSPSGTGVYSTPHSANTFANSR